MKRIRLLGCLNPKMLKPLQDIVPQFDRTNPCLCDNCRNANSVIRPCFYRKNFAWKRCVHYDPIARNSFLAEKIMRLRKWLTLDEAIRLFRTELGSLSEPIEQTTIRQKGEQADGRS